MRSGRGWLIAAGSVLTIVGLVGSIIGAPVGVPRLVVVPMLLVGIVLLALGVVRARRARAIADGDGSEERAPQDRREIRRAFYVRLVVWGLLLVPASIVIAGVGGNFTGAFSVLPPAVIALVVAVVVRLTGRFLVGALVFAILLFLLALLSTSELGHPESFADFVPAIVRLVGLAAAVLGASVAIRQRRHNSLRRANPRERLGVRIGAGALIAASMASFVLTNNARTTIKSADGAIIVNTLEDNFDPDDIEVEAGRVRFLIRNEDSYAHTFSVDELEVDEYIGPRSDRIVAFKVDDAGRYDLYCAINGHETMTGTFRVR